MADAVEGHSGGVPVFDWGTTVVAVAGGKAMLRLAVVASAAVGVSACAGDVSLTPPKSLAPMMMVGGPELGIGQPASLSQSSLSQTSLPQGATTADDQPLQLARKSLAAKVLTARALETVTGLKPDPARLSEHD